MASSRRIPTLGPAVPQRGNRYSRLLGRLVFSALGWRFDGALPNLPKAVLIVVPHTSNWDFLIGIAAVFALGLKASFLGKKNLFRWPLGVMMRWLGGIPIDRRAAHGAVGQVAERMKSADKLLLGLSPEGTRSRVSRWKTGFYYIAEQAGVPIVPIAFDYPTKQIRFFDPLQPSGDLAADIRILESHFTEMVGKRPTNGSKAAG